MESSSIDDSRITAKRLLGFVKLYLGLSWSWAILVCASNLLNSALTHKELPLSLLAVIVSVMTPVKVALLPFCLDASRTLGIKIPSEYLFLTYWLIFLFFDTSKGMGVSFYAPTTNWNLVVQAISVIFAVVYIVMIFRKLFQILPLSEAAVSVSPIGVSNEAPVRRRLLAGLIDLFLCCSLFFVMMIIASWLRFGKNAPFIEYASHQLTVSQGDPYFGMWIFAPISIWLGGWVPAISSVLMLAGATKSIDQLTAAQIGLLLVSIVGILSWLYFAFMESSPWMASLGKRILGLQVVDETGSRLSFYRASLRYFARYASSGTMFFGYLTFLLPPRKQMFHDFLSRCYVRTK